ncbi:MAG: hypothetical protein SYR96_35770 [Actinomycetota bacterium]|nr:hypothetical protein [Actinomycetota bacterium]
MAFAGWPLIDPMLAAEDPVTCVVQVDGKVHEGLEAPAGIGPAELEALALTAIGRRAAWVIVQPLHLVNVMTSA